MGGARTCPACLRSNHIYANFGDNIEAAKAYHNAKNWCKCGYESAEEMMQDQDLGFSDPYWLPIIKGCFNEFFSRYDKGLLESPEEQVRFFLKQLKYSAYNNHRSIKLEAIPYEEIDLDTAPEWPQDGKPAKPTKSKVIG
jgi:hypothetical protein